MSLTVGVGQAQHVVEVDVEVVEKRGLSLEGETVSGNDEDGGSFIACDRSRDDDADDEEKLRRS